MAEDQGASPKEQIVEACRRDNVELFNEVLSSLKGQSPEKIAEFFNSMTDTMGNHLLHVCANYGSYDVMDELLNVEYLECDPLSRRDGETPIHSAVRYADDRDREIGTAMAKMLVDAGGDPRTKDKHGRTPAQICGPTTGELQTWLVSQEYILREGLKQENREAEDEGPTGSASDSE